MACKSALKGVKAFLVKQYMPLCQKFYCFNEKLAFIGAFYYGSSNISLLKCELAI